MSVQKRTRRKRRKADKRTETLSIRLSYAELQWLKLDAMHEGKSIAAYVMDKILGEIVDIDTRPYTLEGQLPLQLGID